MTHRWARNVSLGCGLFLCAAKFIVASAQISLDGTLGRSGPLIGPNFQITSDLGRQMGGNLFHSFKEFSLLKGETAGFSGPGDVQNVLARVTGGTVSSVDGVIRSEIAGANFYLVNPAGVMFGPNASVDVSGSFAVSTADYLKLVGGGRFDAAKPAQSLLTSAPVESFGFLGPQPNAIKIDGSFLSVKDRKDFSLVGGDLDLSEADVRVPGGTLALVSVKSAGEVADSDSQLRKTSSNLELGKIELRNNTVIDAGGGGRVVIPEGLNDAPYLPGKSLGGDVPRSTGPGGGRVVIRSGRLVIDHAALYQTTENDGSDGGIDVQVTSDLSLRNGGHIATTTIGDGTGSSIRVGADRLTLSEHSLITTSTASVGRAGDLDIAAHQVELLSGSQLATHSFGPGDTGDVDLRAASLSLDGQGSPFETTIGTSSNLPRALDPRGSGKAGEVRIETGKLEMVNHPGGALVALGSRTLGVQPSGDVFVKADQIRMNGNDAKGSPLTRQPDTELTLIVSVNYPTSAGQSGNVRVESRDMEIVGYSLISAATFGTGDAGNVEVSTDRLFLSSSSIVSSTGEGSEGNGGSVRVRARQLDIREAGGIGARTSGAGDAGSVDVKADQITLDFGSIYADARDTSMGKGGQVKVTADVINILNSGNIEATTLSLAPKDAGDVSVRAKEITIDWRGQEQDFRTIRFDRTFRGTGIGSQSFGTGGGKGGNVTVEADQLRIIGPRGTISASTESSGDGGKITVTAGDLRLEQGGNINSSSQGSGQSGSVSVAARGAIRLMDGASITTAAPQSTANELVVAAGEGIQLQHSQITSQAAHDGGELRLEATRGNIHLRGSSVISEAGNDGGNIRIITALMTLNASQINANAIRGNGGNIDMMIDFLLSSDPSLRNVTASSELGVDGEISILGPAVDLSGSLFSLPGSLLGAEATLPEHCGINLGQDLSSLLILRRGGLPVQPGGWQPSFLPLSEPPRQPSAPHRSSPSQGAEK